MTNKNQNGQTQNRQTMIQHKWKALLPLFFLLLNTLACTRPEKTPTPEEDTRDIKDVFLPGTTDNLYGISKFQVIDLPSDQLKETQLEGKSVRIKTASEGEEAKVSSSIKNTVIKVSFKNQYQFLDYEILDTEQTDAQKLLVDLLGKVENFKGFPDTVYHIVPHITNNYLILYRLGEKSSIPYDELHVSLKAGEQTATPLVGYPIKYCQAEKVLNINNEETGQNRPKCEGVDRKKATYIRLYKDSKKVFTYKPKVDVFPQGFFDGKWFYATSVVKATQDIKTGYQQGLGTHSFKSAHLVEFQKNINHLSVLDANGNEINEKDKIEGLKLPVEWKEYTMDRDSEELIKSFSEIEREKTEDIDRPFFKILFDQQLESLEIEDDYLSFTIKNIKIEQGQSKNVWIKYAFKKEVPNKNYVEKRWFEKDSSLYFPVYHTIRKYYEDQSVHTPEELIRFHRVTRFDPLYKKNTTQVITWYFSKQTPKDDYVRDFGRQAVQLWNKAFQEAGKGSDYKIEIVLDESEEKELGDIRYNIINLMYSPGQKEQLIGLGPNISNPITGETLSATANVWLNQIIHYYIIMIRRYIRHHIWPSAWEILPNSPGPTTFLSEKIQKMCPLVTTFIEQNRGTKFHPETSVLKDKEITEACAYKLSRSNILSTLLHEIGHCFSYRHVFSASADKDNHYTSYDEIKKIFGTDLVLEDDNTPSHPQPAQFSSVMDYGSNGSPMLSVPGKYDIAVTRFVYFDKVELEDGQLLTVPAGADSSPNNPQKSIQDIAKEKNVKVKKYKVCGGKDYHVTNSDINVNDPFCSRFDYGTSPLDITNNIISNSLNNWISGHRRHDSANTLVAYPPVLRPRTTNNVTILTLLNKWIELRNKLFNERNEKITNYSFLKEADVQKYKDLIQSEVKRNSEFRAYYEVRQTVFNYYKKMLFMPIKQCIYKKPDGSWKSIALEFIEQQIERQYAENSGELFISCQSPVVQKWAKKNINGQFISEVGYFLNHKTYFLNDTTGKIPQDLTLFNDIFWRSLAIYSLIDFPTAPSTMILLLTEPDLARELIFSLEKDIMEGADLNPYLDKEFNLPRLPYYIFGLNVLFTKATILEAITSLYSVYHTDISKRYNYFSSWLSKSDLIETVKTQPLGKHNQTIFNDIYKEYIKTNKEPTEEQDFHNFYDYIFNHPAIFRTPDNRVLVPFSIDNFYARLFKKYNTYKKCIENARTVGVYFCKDKIEKEYYIHYIDFIIENISLQFNQLTPNIN